jgi:hypothetical protein
VLLPIQWATKHRRCQTQHTPEESPWTTCSFRTTTAIPRTLLYSVPHSLPSSHCGRPRTWTSNWIALPFVLIEIATVKWCTRPWMTYEQRRLTISSRGVSDVFAMLATMISRIFDGKVVMFTPLVLRLSMVTRRNAERRGCVSQDKRCRWSGCVRRKSSWSALSLRLV